MSKGVDVFFLGWLCALGCGCFAIYKLLAVLCTASP